MPQLRLDERVQLMAAPAYISAVLERELADLLQSHAALGFDISRCCDSCDSPIDNVASIGLVRRDGKRLVLTCDRASCLTHMGETC